MSSQPTKPREWKFKTQGTRFGPELVCVEGELPIMGSTVHVIEISAMQAAEEQVKELEGDIETVERTANNYRDAFKKGLDKIARLEKALEKCRKHLRLALPIQTVKQDMELIDQELTAILEAADGEKKD